MKWEYLVKLDLIEIDLASLGKDGWELCGIDGSNFGTTYYFKRPLPTVEELATELNQMLEKSKG